VTISSARPPKLAALQVLRAVAASLVVLDHSLNALVDHAALPATVHRLSYLSGWLGVAVFFVTSGLIMYLTTHARFGSAAEARRFAGRRIIRVVPMYWLATALAALPHLGGTQPADITRSLLFIPYLDPGAGVMRPVLGVGWTLNYEMFFYALFTAALLLPRRVGLSAILTALLGLVALGGLHHSLLDYRDPTTLVDFYTDPLLLLFAAGVGIGWLTQRRPVTTRLPAAVLAVAGVVAAAAAGATFPLPVGWQAVLGAAAALSVLAATVPAAGGRLLQAAGDASYSTYLLHLFVVAVLIRMLPIPPPAFVVICIVAANAVGWLAYRLVERPILRRLRRPNESRITCRSTTRRRSAAGSPR
jgi:exopolysaccharide production protein ExoZ